MINLHNRLQQIFEDQLDATCVISPDLRIILANPAFARRFNQLPDSLIGMDYRKLLPDQVRAQVLTALAELTPDTPTCVLQLEMSQETGSIRVTEFHGRAVFDERGGLIEYQTFGRQLTEQIAVQRELERKNRFLDIIMEILPVSLAIRDAKTRRFVLVNRAVGTDKSAADYIG
ncbi:MAG: PAS domain-containing protein, partial [Alphaproteobacteria bacterium]|nr:PAS domain-containing protein [Alphaproteobacteria bacterium]